MLSKILNTDWEIYFFIALVITIISHIPRIIANGMYGFGSPKADRVLSDPNNFWTTSTLVLHLITAFFLSLAILSYLKK